MVKFRRSVKGERPDGKPHHISIPPKDAIAIVPPKKVIKALYDYNAPNPDGYLSFTQGDFLHVVGREHDHDWYEACNPLHGTRGLVPVKYFEGVGKTVRDSGSSTKSAPISMPSTAHDSGYAERTPASAGVEMGPRATTRLSKLAKGSGAMVYGIVMYDFKAERPDELEAKEGEAIIVIAQSNPEWFVAKPITRLGGPGLIPVSFIEIRDMSTGQAVADPQDAVQKAGVPKVEEWKKMAADYKNGSIPLGKLEGTAVQGLQGGMERMSLNGKGPGAYDGNGYAPPHSTHSRNASGYAEQNPYARQSGQHHLAPVNAKVPRYCFAEEIFWFVVEAQMEDGRHWELSRIYQDFYDLQINLIQEFPLEAGNIKGVERSLPYMPGPVTYVTDNISNGRRANLDEYIKNLLRLGQHITRSHLVRKFFAPRKGDYEIDPDVSPGGYRLSGGSQQSSTDPSQGASRQSSAGNLNHNQQSYHQPNSGYPSHQRGPSTQGSHYRGASDLQIPQAMLRQNSSLTQGSASSTATGGTAPVTGGATKIKVWFEQDNCVVLRMPPNFRFADLGRKLRDRRAMERPDEGNNPSTELAIEYRDELDGKYYRIDNDDDLQLAMDRSPKLTLSVTTVG